MDLDNDNIVVVEGDCELSEAFKSLDIDDYVKVGMFAATFLGLSDHRSPKDIYKEFEMASGELFIDEIMKRFDLRGNVGVGFEMVCFLCTLLAHVAGTVYGNARMLSHDLSLAGLQMDPLDCLLSGKTTPPPRLPRRCDGRERDMSGQIASADIQEVLREHDIGEDDLTVESLCRLYRLIDFALREADGDGIEPVGLMATTLRLCFFPEGDFRHAIFHFDGPCFEGVSARVSIGSDLCVSTDAKLLVCDRFHVIVFAFSKWAEEIEESRGEGESAIAGQIAGKALSFMERVGR